MLSYWIDLGFSFLEPSTISWRFPIAFQIVLALFILCAIPGLPESPRWLVLKGREDDALQVLCALSDLPPEDKKIQSEFQAVKDTVFEMSKGGFKDCFKMNRNRNFHRTALAYVNQMFQQVSGWHVVLLLERRITRNDRVLTLLVSDQRNQYHYVLCCNHLRAEHWPLWFPQPPVGCLQRHRILDCLLDCHLYY